ncbi:sigma-70 family RNA polymerase sigma factor [Candidatus Micrarchaeota archaeon]|nr:sigma-70 family RNA polymerase sigma factor [Candidatus Micrarchaeota archaeon]MBD3417407.1 sigma-70 family RNA polymerase sigma factor [Candidatus Micrarchaeota archaeon]
MRNLTIQQLKQDAEKTRKPILHERRKFPKKTHAEREMPGTPVPIRRSREQAWKIVMDNYPLVLKSIQMRGLNRRPNAGPDDVLQNALIVAHYAARRWDQQRGTFSSYLLSTMKRTWRMNAEEKLLVRIPNQTLNEIAKYRRWKDRNPVLGALDYAEHAGITQKVAKRIEAAARTYSCCLYPPNANSLLESGPRNFRIGESMEGTREVQLDDLDPSVVQKILPFIEEEVDGAKLAENTKRALELLHPRERETLEVRFGIGKDDERPLDEVAEHFSITRERARQIECKSMRKLRHSSRSKYLR